MDRDRVPRRPHGAWPWLVMLLATVALAGFASLWLMVLTPMALARARPASAIPTELLPYNGGAVLHSSRPYLIFWTPGGERIAASSESLIERYFKDVGADSGKSSNVFGVLRQYYDHAGFADYRQTFDPARQVIVDTHRYPRRDAFDCPDLSVTYPTCITESQIQAEVLRLVRADKLPTAGKPDPEPAANTPIYLFVMPPDVTLCDFFGHQCTDKNAIAFHWWTFDSHGNAVLYSATASDPLRGVTLPSPMSGACDPGGTGAAQEPNGDPADCVINWLSDEDSDMITDPFHDGWDIAAKSWETGDACQHIDINPLALLPTLGGSASTGTLYTQVINGDHYYTQSEWSDGDGKCEMQPSAGRIAPRFTVRSRRPSTSVAFNPAASTSTNAISSATWKFGDGSRPAFRAGRAARNRVEHRYRKAGRYTVTLTLVDNRGNLKTITRRVAIHGH
jgi:hypothetical protein